MKVLTKLLWLFALIFSTSFTFGQNFPLQAGSGASPATNILSLFNIPYGPGNSTNLTIVINKNFGDPRTNWQYTPTVVQPVPLTITANQDGQVTLTWPYTADTSTLESCSDLNAPQWQPVTNMTITLANGFYHATGPIAATNQFFRLRPN